MQTNKLIKSSMLIMAATIFSNFIGFFREIVIGNVLGTTNIADAYFVAISIPSIIFAGLAGAIGTTFIPMYVKQKERLGDGKSIIFVNNVINIILLLSILFALISIVFVRPIISLIAYGFDAETMDIAVNIARIVFLQIIVMGVIEIFKGYLNTNNRYIAPTLMAVPYSVFIIISLLFYDKIGIIGVAYATLFGMVAKLLMLFINSNFVGYRPKPILNFHDKEIKTMLALALPVFIGSSIGQLNSIVYRMLASGLEEGSLAALSYASKLNAFVYGILSMVIFTVIYPMLSRLNAKENKEAYKSLLSKSINIVTIWLIPMAVGICILREPIIKVLFERGVFDTRSTDLTSSALLFYSIGLLYMGYVAILSRGFYSIQDTKSPAISSAVALSISIALNVVLVGYMQHNALALSTSVCSIINAAILAYVLRKKIGHIGGKGIVITFVKSSISALIMGILVFELYEHLTEFFLSSTTVIQLGVIIFVVAIGGLAYLGLHLLLRTEELIWFAKNLFNKR